MNQQSLTVWFIALVFTTVTPNVGYTATIDFETIPGVEEPFEGLEISNQFSATENISFSLEGGGFPIIAEVGSPRTAFAGPPNNLGSDNLLGGQDIDIGSFFLTDDGVLSGLSSPALIVDYNEPTAEASGVILDIDFDENFIIEARDETGSFLEEIIISAGDEGTGDGVATEWSFNRDVEDVFSISFQGTRQASGAFGLGFDNFNAFSDKPNPDTTIPEPSSLISLFAFGALGIISVSKRR